jgi:L-threonylcarbamoyladenylate synthase
MKIIRLTETNHKDAAREAAEALRKGGIILYPTDTLYGLAVDALNPHALARLRAIKGREKRKPISVALPSVAHIESHAVLTPQSRAIAEQFLPGPLTLVLTAYPHVPEELTLNGAVGIRVPNDPFVLALAEAFENPFTATSANRSGWSAPTNIPDALEHFGPAIDQLALIIDDGERGSGLSSTVVSFAGDTPVILREGVITREQLGL